jgi:Bardet-Biedl syndrome 9 protein
MSVFGVKDIWVTSLGNDEEFDVNSMCWIESLGLVVTGSLQGFLRIYRPQQRPFQPEDLVLERQLDPILQVSAGEFVRGSAEQVIAVLHSKRLAVYRVQVTESINSLGLCYKHDFQYNVFNFTFGHISEAQSLIICVQSSNGDLFFIEYEGIQFGIRFPLFVVPGPLTFCSWNSSLLVCNANMEVEKYSYIGLHQANEARRGGREAKFVPETTCNIGEYALAITVELSTRTVFVLGEHSIFTLSENLILLAMKRLDYPPSCLVAFTKDSSQLMLICGSFTGHLLVYEGQHLVWTAKCEDPPIAMHRVSLLIPGLLLMLSETGRLRVSFLGTSPLPHNIVPPQPMKPIEAMEGDLRRCQEMLTQSLGVPDEGARKLGVSINVEAAPRMEPHFVDGFVSENSLVTTYASVTVSSAVTISNLTIQVCTAKGIESTENPLYLESLQGRTSYVFTFSFMTRSDCFVSSLDGRLSIAYRLDKSCKVAEVPFRLPFKQIAASGSYEESKHQMVFSIKTPAPPLRTLFQDFDPQASHSILFKFFSGEFAAINASKTGPQVQISGSDFSAMALVAEELSLRLEQASSQLIYEGIPPLAILYTSITAHHTSRKALSEAEAELGQQMEQFIAVQKRMLTRFKDRSPAPVNNLDYLLQRTLRYLEDLTERVEQLQYTVGVTGEKLSSTVRLILMTARSLFKLTDADYAVLKAYLPIEVSDGEISWEEMALSGVIELLRTKLAKNDRERSIGRGSLEFPSATDQLEKNIGIVFERLSKGQRLT